MIDYKNCNIEQVAVHKVGNKTHHEKLFLSKKILDTSDVKLNELLKKYFLKPFAETEFYNFTFSDDDFELNPIYHYAKTFFADSNAFHKTSIRIAKHLFEVSMHPNIKSGDLFVAKFNNIQIGEDEVTDVIGIFKSEIRQSFLKVNSKKDDFILKYEDGINIDKLDKGCLIFNVAKSEGYKVCIIDKLNKSMEAQYWRDLFLKITPCKDNYHFTKEFLDLTKSFVTNQISEEFDLSKTDKIDMLNRSVDYFKTHDSFNKREFEENVFNDDSFIESFRNYDRDYKRQNEISIDEDFEISTLAVKKQVKAFKSVLKLDDNFDIFIHGDNSKITQGVEKDGRKFYKIYYENEV
jgi:37-kD nucleoid-associated bacterial protein